MFRFSCGHPDKEGRQKSEYVCLKEGHQQLYAVHEQHKEYGDRGHKHRLENKYKSNKAQHNYVAGRNVGKKTDHQCKRL